MYKYRYIYKTTLVRRICFQIQSNCYDLFEISQYFGGQTNQANQTTTVRQNRRQKAESENAGTVAADIGQVLAQLFASAIALKYL